MRGIFPVLILSCAFFFTSVPVSCRETEDVPATEDLMREHGVLDRILLVYSEINRRLENGKALPRGVLLRAAELTRSFIQEYHEKLEEEYVFPALEKAGKESSTVAILKRQHEAGRKLMASVMQAARAPGHNRRLIVRQLSAFSRMYRPHKAREDTVVFPAFRNAVPAAEFQAYGKKFDEREQNRFQGDGFTKAVGEVAALEKELGTGDLSRYTPRG
jgi:hemerythrin-like domain-containing protein